MGSTGLCETLLKVSHEASLTEPEPVCGPGCQSEASLGSLSAEGSGLRVWPGIQPLPGSRVGDGVD